MGGGRLPTHIHTRIHTYKHTRIHIQTIVFLGNSMTTAMLLKSF